MAHLLLGHNLQRSEALPLESRNEELDPYCFDAMPSTGDAIASQHFAKSVSEGSTVSFEDWLERFCQSIFSSARRWYLRRSRWRCCLSWVALFGRLFRLLVGFGWTALKSCCGCVLASAFCLLLKCLEELWFLGLRGGSERLSMGTGRSEGWVGATAAPWVAVLLALLEPEHAASSVDASVVSLCFCSYSVTASPGAPFTGCLSLSALGLQSASSWSSQP